MSSYLLYYLAIFFFSYAAQNPYVLVVALVLFALRGVLPDPAALLRALRYLRLRKSEIALNPANVKARRDLARIYLDLHRPGAAVRVLSPARESRDREIAYLVGIALLRSGDPEAALPALGEAAGMNPKTGSFDSESKPSPTISNVRSAEIFLVAATALERLGRFEQAEEALVSACELNSSSIEARVRLAAIYGRKGDARLRERAIDDIGRTWSTLPAFARRGQWSWYVRGLTLRVF